MPKINPNRDAQIAAYTWAVGEFQETVDFATRWEQDTVVSRRMAYDHYFGPQGTLRRT